MKKHICLLLSLLLALSCLYGLPAAAGEEYTLPKEEGMNQLTFYWKMDGADYSTCDMWIWMPGKDGKGYPFHECEYGAKVVVNVPKDVSSVGFIVRRDCSNPGGTSWGSAVKDYDSDRFAEMTGPDTFIYLLPGDGNQYVSHDGGKTLENIREFTSAAIISPTEIRYFISPATKLTSLSQTKVYRNGLPVKVAKLSSLNNEVITGIVTLEEELSLSDTYELEIDGFGRMPAMPTALFDSKAFNEAYTYDGDDLGAVPQGDKTQFKLWAPTAKDVTLNLFTAGDGAEAYAKLPMKAGEKGVWSLTADCGAGTYYTYTVTTAAGAAEAVDPYAKAVGVNGDRGMVIDLPATDPEGFRDEKFEAAITTYNDAVIWEVHVRDFSNRIASSAYPGKYLAFTETGLVNEAGEKVGVDYLKELGITHVHFQPIYDYATVDETRLDEPQFNWGYDPKNYNAPEGSYSTDPYHGEVRVRELKQMVQALHRAGIGVVMDVVYNHTYSQDSCLNRVVPYYYYRWNADGTSSNGSGCGNETASERTMFRKYMVDSVVYWLEEYQLDGFRFDLMALHDTTTMQQIEQAVHARNPKALLYGEGWTGGTSPLNPNLQCTQANMRRVTATEGAAGGIAVFNDVIRDGLKGSVFNRLDRGYISGRADKETANRVIFGFTGGNTGAAAWKSPTAMVVNYMTSHDNQTLWDKLEASAPEATAEERAAMVRLGASAVLLSKGMPFFLAGEEMLRTKLGDENSYNSSDEVNNIDWEALKPGSLQAETSAFYRELIRLRKENAFLTDPDVQVSGDILNNQVVCIRYEKDGALLGAALLNPNAEAVSVVSGLPAGLKLLMKDGSFLPEVTLPGGPVKLDAKSVLLAKAE